MWRLWPTGTHGPARRQTPSSPRRTRALEDVRQHGRAAVRRPPPTPDVQTRCLVRGNDPPTPGLAIRVRAIHLSPASPVHYKAVVLTLTYAYLYQRSVFVDALLFKGLRVPMTAVCPTSGRSTLGVSVSQGWRGLARHGGTLRPIEIVLR